MAREEATEIEQPCVDIAIAAGWMHRKLDVGPGGKGWLDQIFIGPKGKHFFVEFKTLLGGLSPKQLQTMQDLQALGHDCFVVYKKEQFKFLLEEYR